MDNKGLIEQAMSMFRDAQREYEAQLRAKDEEIYRLKQEIDRILDPSEMHRRMRDETLWIDRANFS